MWKFLIILFLVGYIFYKAGNFIFRLFLGRAMYQQQQQRKKQQSKRNYNGINVDYKPDNGKSTKRSASNYKGGEYIDYEEVN